VTSCASDQSGGLPTVIIGKAVDTIGFSTVEVAQAMGYFKDAGVSVQTKLLQGSSQTNAALQGGSIQFATLSSTALLLAASKGVQLQAITSLDYGASVQVVVNKGWSNSHHIDASQPLKQRMEGLAGAKDAAISSTGISVLKLMLNRNGVSPDSVQFVTVGSDAAAAAALGHNTLQVFVGSPPSTYYMADNTGSTVLASASEIDQMRDMAYDLLITTPGFASDQPKTATAVATALARAENLMRTDPAKVLDTEAKHFPSYNRDHLLKSLQSVQWTTDGLFTQAMWDDAVAITKEQGQLANNVDVTEGGLWTNKYVDVNAVHSKGGQGGDN
jgi:NitT/TauT family transport system substrate-binding protein